MDSRINQALNIWLSADDIFGRMLATGDDSDARILIEEADGNTVAIAIHKCVLRHQTGLLKDELAALDDDPNATIDWRRFDPAAVKRVVSWLYYVYQSGADTFRGAMTILGPDHFPLETVGEDSPRRMMSGKTHHVPTFMLSIKLGLYELSHVSLDEFHRDSKQWLVAHKNANRGAAKMPAFMSEGIDTIYGGGLPAHELKDAGRALTAILINYPSVFKSAEMQACLAKHAAFGADVVCSMISEKETAAQEARDLEADHGVAHEAAPEVAHEAAPEAAREVTREVTRETAQEAERKAEAESGVFDLHRFNTIRWFRDGRPNLPTQPYHSALTEGLANAPALDWQMGFKPELRRAVSPESRRMGCDRMRDVFGADGAFEERKAGSSRDFY